MWYPIDWQGACVILAVAALVVLHRGFAKLAAARQAQAEGANAQAMSLASIAGAISSFVEVLERGEDREEKADEAIAEEVRNELLRQRTQTARDEVLLAWGSGSGSGDWEMSVTGLSLFSSSDGSSPNEITFEHPDQGGSFDITIATEGPCFVVRGCEILMALGEHGSRCSSTDVCSVRFEDYEVDGVLRRIGAFLRENPRGFPVDEDQESTSATTVS